MTFLVKNLVTILKNIPKLLKWGKIIISKILGRAFYFYIFGQICAFSKWACKNPRAPSAYQHFSLFTRHTHASPAESTVNAYQPSFGSTHSPCSPALFPRVSPNFQPPTGPAHSPVRLSAPEYTAPLNF